MQFDRTVDGVRWINAGSIGMPYEGEVAAFWASLGPGVTLRKTPYDVEAAAERVLATDWPDAEAFVSENMRTAIAPEEAIPIFERQAVERGERVSERVSVGCVGRPHGRDGAFVVEEASEAPE